MKTSRLPSYMLLSMLFLGISTESVALKSTDSPDNQAKYDSALVRVELADERIDQAELMIRDGKQLVKEGIRDKKRLTKEINSLEINSLTKSHNRDIKQYDAQKKSKDKEAKAAVLELKTT